MNYTILDICILSKSEEGRGHWTVNYIGTQSVITSLPCQSSNRKGGSGH